jgi:hypothetical protein
MGILKFVAHSKKAITIAIENGWFPGARYTNLRDVKSVPFQKIGFLDIDWKNYDFSKHMEIASAINPKLTIARDVESIFELDNILMEAEQLSKYSSLVAIVPKDIKLADRLEELIPNEFILAYSVPTKYGGTCIPVKCFERPVHLLGGRPDTQRYLANKLKVISFDCNRFTFDARYGDYFDGEIFRPHPKGGYERCLEDSIKNINALWDDYVCSVEAHSLLKDTKKCV